MFRTYSKKRARADCDVLTGIVSSTISQNVAVCHPSWSSCTTCSTTPRNSIHTRSPWGCAERPARYQYPSGQPPKACSTCSSNRPPFSTTVNEAWPSAEQGLKVCQPLTWYMLANEEWCSCDLSLEGVTLQRPLCWPCFWNQCWHCASQSVSYIHTTGDASLNLFLVASLCETRV